MSHHWLHTLDRELRTRHSTVITSIKMTRYYKAVKLINDLYSWSSMLQHLRQSIMSLTQFSAVFDEHSLIFRIYRDLESQHYLVQKRCDKRSDISDLTSIDFAKWVTLLIQAHSEEKYEMLQKIVLEMSISNSDERKRDSQHSESLTIRLICSRLSASEKRDSNDQVANTD